MFVFLNIYAFIFTCPGKGVSMFIRSMMLCVYNYFNFGKKFKKASLPDKIKKSKALTMKTTNIENTCVVCLKSVDKNFIQWSSCQNWAHEACADIPECSGNYICNEMHIILRLIILNLLCPVLGATFYFSKITQGKV